MPSRPPVDPELVPFLDALPAFDFRPETLADIRRDTDAMPPAHAPVGPAAALEERLIPGRAGAPPVRVLVYRPLDRGAGEALPGILHMHGGGFVIWRPEINDARNRWIAGDLRAVVVSVDYRRSPETPSPGPLEDCYAALLWLSVHADELGVDRSRLAVKGESAGGGLAAALALLARGRGEVPLAFQHLTYPMLDDRTGAAGGPPPLPGTGELVWTAANNRFGWRALLGREPGEDDVPSVAVPARAESLAGLPPAFLQVGALDLFLGETLAFAMRLLQAGVPTELHVYPGMFHGADFIPGTRLTAAFMRDAHEALRRALEPRGAR